MCVVDESGKIHGNLIMGKSCVARLKYITIPRMELAATLSVKISVILRKEFQLPVTREIFWTDSEAVSYVLSVKIQVDSPKKNNDGYNQRSITWQ